MAPLGPAADRATRMCGPILRPPAGSHRRDPLRALTALGATDGSQYLQHPCASLRIAGPRPTRETAVLSVSGGVAYGA